MYYHPFIGIAIFLIAIIGSFILGKFYIRKKHNKIINYSDIENTNIPKGEITSPDAPWLDDK